MCLVIPGKIIEIDVENVVVDYGPETRKARLITGGFEVGDYVLVRGGIVFEKVPFEQVKVWREVIKK